MYLVVYQTRTGQWRWHVRARNGRKIAEAGESYKNKGDLKRIAMKLFGDMIETGQMKLELR